MKVCQINCVYDRGSTGTIVRNLHVELQKKGYESIVIYPVPNHSKVEPGVYSVSNKALSFASAFYRRLFGRQFDGAFIQTTRIINILKREQPDIVHLHCINGNNINVYRVLKYLAENRVMTLLTLHAEFMYTGGCEHAYDCEKWKTGCVGCPDKRQLQTFFIDGAAHTWKSLNRCYSLFDKTLFRYVAVSPWLEKRAKQSRLLSRFSGCTIPNGIDVSTYTYADASGLRRELGVAPSEKIILHVTAYFDPTSDNLKGGKYVVELAKRVSNENARVIVVANRVVDSPLPDNVICVGRIASAEQLARFYNAADLTLIASKRETFSMPAAESLCCGTPVVGFEAGGPESIALEEYSSFVPYGDLDALQEQVSIMLRNTYDKKQISYMARECYSRETMLLRYLKQYKEKE